MANPTFKNASGTSQSRAATGTGTDGDPFILINSVSGTVAATQSGTWTVQPGNTANTTAWLVTGTGGTFPVTDNGGSLTVDGTVAATQSGTWNVTNISGTISLPTGAATQTTLAAAADSLVAIDASLSNITRAEDAVHTTGDRGVVNLAVRRDSLTGTAADGDYITLSADSTGRLYVNSTDQATAAAGGLTAYALNASAATNNATSVKASAGRVYAVIATNNGAANRYLKLYNKASAPSPASDTPVATYMLPAGGGICRITDIGLVFSTGIAFAVVAGISATDNTSISASEVAVNIEYA